MISMPNIAFQLGQNKLALDNLMTREVNVKVLSGTSECQAAAILLLLTDMSNSMVAFSAIQSAYLSSRESDGVELPKALDSLTTVVSKLTDEVGALIDEPNYISKEPVIPYSRREILSKLFAWKKTGLFPSKKDVPTSGLNEQDGDITKLLHSIKINFKSISKCLDLYKRCAEAKSVGTTALVSDFSNVFSKRIDSKYFNKRVFKENLASKHRFTNNLIHIEILSGNSVIGNLDAFYQGIKKICSDTKSLRAVKKYLEGIFRDSDIKSNALFDMGFIDPLQFKFVESVLLICNTGTYENLEQLKDLVQTLIVSEQTLFEKRSEEFRLACTEMGGRERLDRPNLCDSQEQQDEILAKIKHSVVGENIVSYLFSLGRNDSQGGDSAVSDKEIEVPVFNSSSVPSKLLDVISHPFYHSISNINQYVSSKWDYDFMRQLITTQVPVDVYCSRSDECKDHLLRENYDKLIQFKSENSLERYLAVNTTSGDCKFIVRIDLGESYKIHTIGQMLLYEVYVNPYDGSMGFDIVPPEGQGPTEGEVAGRDDFDYVYNKDVVVGDGDCYLYKNRLDQLIAIPKGNILDERAVSKLVFRNNSEGKGVLGMSVIARRLDPSFLSVKSCTGTEGLRQTMVNRFSMILRENDITKVDILALGGAADFLKLMSRKQNIERRCIVSDEGFNVTIFDVKELGVPKKVILSGCISPGFFGDKSGFLVEALIPLGLGSILLTGTSGGMGAQVAMDTIVLPQAILDSERTSFQFNTEFSKQDGIVASLSEYDSSILNSKYNIGVDSPIVEGMQYLKDLAARESGIASVECEAHYIARAIGKENIKFYPYFRVTDNPFTGQSISSGGHAESNPSTPTKMKPVTSSSSLSSSNGSSEKAGGRRVKTVSLITDLILNVELGEGLNLNNPSISYEKPYSPKKQLGSLGKEDLILQ
jgi:hypothetical protein